MASDLEDIGEAAAALSELEGLADSFGRAMTSAFRQSAIEGRKLDDVLRSIALSLSSRALTNALAPLGGAIGDVLGGATGRGLGGSLPNNAPAIRATGGMHVTFNVTTADAASFRKAEADVTAMLARAVARGKRGL
jgi:hypothetical protein